MNRDEFSELLAALIGLKADARKAEEGGPQGNPSRPEQHHLTPTAQGYLI